MKTARLAVIATILLTALFYAPALLGGYLADDHFHLFALSELPQAIRDGNLFSFVRGPSEVTALRNWGVVPWWTSDAMRIDFYRPIPSFTHALDFRLFGRDPVLAHAVSIVWYGVVLGLVARVYRRFTEGRAFVLALVIFALDDTHALVVEWLANRADLIGAAFVASAFLAWLRVLEHRRTRDRAWVILFFVLALLSKESSVILPALLVAHAWSHGHLRREPRLLALTCGVAIAWVALYLGAGHGASSVYYLNPTQDPLGWGVGLVRAVGYHAVILVTGLPLHVLSIAPLRDQPVLTAVCFVATIAFFALAHRLLHRDRGARFFFAWTALSLAILTTTFPDPRLLMLPSIGFSFLVARTMEELWNRRAAWTRPVLATLMVLHLVVAPLLDQVCMAVLSRLQRGYDELRAGMESTVDYARVPEGGVDVFFLTFHPREASALANLWLTRHLPNSDVGGVLADPSLSYVDKIDRGFAAMNVHYHALSYLGEREDVVVDVVDDRTLELAPRAGSFMPTLFEQLYLTRAQFAVGETFTVRAFSARIVAVDRDGLPTRVRFTFPQPLSSPRYRFVAWDGTRFHVVALEEGGRIALRAVR